MCGIVGILASGRGAPGVDRALIDRMTSAIEHRGPDAAGMLVEPPILLGHRRLSIIDLTEAGCQPMQDASSRFVIAYNGEVYNYVELRDRLRDLGHTFRTRTDTEVVLAAYREWGPRAVERFNGMWALAIWDRERQELFLCRDRAGKKPLYHARDRHGTLHFASEIKALRAAGLQFGLEPQAVFDFITQGTYGHLGDRGFFHGVRQLPAAHWMLVRADGTEELQRYWDIPVAAERERRPYDATVRREFRELVIDSVRLRLRSDVPVGATLSGGLDSSTIAVVVNELTGGAPMHLFTSLFPGSRHDETPYFNAVVERLRQPLVHRVSPERGSWPEALERVLTHQEEPFGDTSIFAHFDLMRDARRAGVPVVLSGQGGDELLLGYPSMVNAYLGHLLAKGRLRRGLTEARLWSQGLGTTLSAAVRAALPHALPLGLRDRARAAVIARRTRLVSPQLRLQATLKRFEAVGAKSSLDSYLGQVFSRFAIPHLVHYDDRNAMAWSIEGRMPFLDYRLVEFVGTIAYDALFSKGYTKRVLRDAFADLLPPLVAQRRDKVGFHTPLGSWLRENRQWLRAFMSTERVVDAGVLQPDIYASALTRVLAGDDGSALDVWRGAILHLWMDRFEVPGLAGNAEGRGIGRPSSRAA
jgi:asparagine synthase (glutamine-hydrolysing)